MDRLRLLCEVLNICCPMAQMNSAIGQNLSAMAIADFYALYERLAFDREYHASLKEVLGGNLYLVKGNTYATRV